MAMEVFETGTQSTINILLLLAVCLLAEHVHANNKENLAALSSSAKVDPNLIEQFSGNDLQDAYIVYYDSNEVDSATIAEGIINDLDSSTLALQHFYTLIPAISIKLTSSDAVTLIDDGRVKYLLNDPVGRITLNHATQVIGSDVLNVPPFNLSGFSKTVAVIDTGVDLQHPDLQSSIHPVQRCICSFQGCCPDGSNNAQDDNGHGTQIIGVIAAPSGVAPYADILPIKALNSIGDGLSSDVLQALETIALNPFWGVDAVNLSIAFPGGGPYFSSECSAIPPWDLFVPIIANLNNQGILVIAASANDSDPTTEGAPACMSSVVSVGSTWTRSGDPIPGFNGCTGGGP